MARARQWNRIADPETVGMINPENMALIEDFAIYLQSIDRSPLTIEHYKADLLIFFAYNARENGNKRFTEVTKREFVRFQNHALNVWKWSPNRIRTVKSAISSLSNYIENIQDGGGRSWYNSKFRISGPKTSFSIRSGRPMKRSGRRVAE